MGSVGRLAAWAVGGRAAQSWADTRIELEGPVRKLAEAAPALEEGQARGGEVGRTLARKSSGRQSVLVAQCQSSRM